MLFDNINSRKSQQLCVYDILGKALPVLLENEKGIVCANEVYRTEWWNDSSKESEVMPEPGISPDKVAILRDDVNKFFKISHWLLEALEKKVSVQAIPFGMITEWH